MHDTEHLLQKRICELEQLISNKRKALQSAPEGSVYIYHRKGHAQCYWFKPGEQKTTYVCDANLIRRLSQKEYDEKVLRSAEAELTFLNKVLHKYPEEIPESIYTSYNLNKQQFVTPIRLSDEEYVKNWCSVKYTPKGFREGAPDYVTDHGEQVRSKSEMFIANRLFMREIPYLYEYPLRLNGVGILYPDFRVLNVRLRKEYIYEHFGMMDDRDYADKAVKKLNLYANHGIFLGDKLVITSETRMQPLTMKTIDNIIDHYFV